MNLSPKLKFGALHWHNRLLTLHSAVLATPGVTPARCCLMTRLVMTEPQASSPPKLFLPSKRYRLTLVWLGVAVLGLALFLRYGLIQNTQIGLACEAGEESFTCMVRLAVILLFARNLFGWTALAAAILQLISPNRTAFGIGLVAAALGLVLYNLRLSALAVALLVLSLARAAPEGRLASGTRMAPTRPPASEGR
jgi:hypothetical protein